MRLVLVASQLAALKWKLAPNAQSMLMHLTLKASSQSHASDAQGIKTACKCISWWSGFTLYFCVCDEAWMRHLHSYPFTRNFTKSPMYAEGVVSTHSNWNTLFLISFVLLLRNPKQLILLQNYPDSTCRSIPEEL